VLFSWRGSFPTSVQLSFSCFELACYARSSLHLYLFPRNALLSLLVFKLIPLHIFCWSPPFCVVCLGPGAWPFVCCVLPTPLMDLGRPVRLLRPFCIFSKGWPPSLLAFSNRTPCSFSNTWTEQAGTSLFHFFFPLY